MLFSVYWRHDKPYVRKAHKVAAPEEEPQRDRQIPRGRRQERRRAPRERLQDRQPEILMKNDLLFFD